MILAYGFLWERSPKSVAWYNLVHEMTVTGKAPVSAPVEVRQPLKR
jgi:hypothetical protein